MSVVEVERRGPATGPASQPAPPAGGLSGSAEAAERSAVRADAEGGGTKAAGGTGPTNDVLGSLRRRRPGSCCLQQLRINARSSIIEPIRSDGS